MVENFVVFVTIGKSGLIVCVAFFVIKENPKNFACHLFSAGKIRRSTPALDLTKKVDTDVLILSQVTCAAVLFFLSKGRYDESDDRSCALLT